MKQPAPTDKKKLVMGGGAVLALCVAAFLLFIRSTDDPKVDPKVAEKASQIEADLRAVNPPPPPPPPMAAAVAEPAIPAANAVPEPQSLRGRNK